MKSLVRPTMGLVSSTFLSLLAKCPWAGLASSGWDHRLHSQAVTPPEKHAEPAGSRGIEDPGRARRFSSCTASDSSRERNHPSEQRLCCLTKLTTDPLSVAGRLR